MSDNWGEAWSRLNSALEFAREHMTEEEIRDQVDEVLAPVEDTIVRQPKPKKRGQ